MSLPVFTEQVRKRNCYCLSGCVITTWVGLDNTSERCVKKIGGLLTLKLPNQNTKRQQGKEHKDSGENRGKNYFNQCSQQYRLKKKTFILKRKAKVTDFFNEKFSLQFGN